MIRVLIFLVVLTVAAFGIDWFAAHPGTVVVTWQDYEYKVSLLVALGALLAAAVVLIVLWSILRLLFRTPSKVVRASRMRRRSKGFAALSSGVVAVAAGNSREAKRHAREAERYMPNEPLTQLLKAQAAQLAGDRATAEASFTQMLKTPATQTLGLRGLHLEARRRGDHEAAYQFARKAGEIAPLPWAGQAALQHLAANGDWDGALAVLDSNASAGTVDKATADRQRAVLQTALAREKFDREPATALALAREANRLAPDLVPAAVLAGRLLTRQGDIARAMRILELAWRRCPHPDIAEAYLGVRPGDSARDRLARAHEFGQWAQEDQEGRIVVARAALEARDAELARKTMMPVFAPTAPLGRPTVRACLLMADIEEYCGAPGKVREWLARSSVAARDAAWIADGVVAPEWAPVSPATGRLDAFVWQKPPENLAALPPITLPVDHVADDGRANGALHAPGAAVPAPLPAPERTDGQSREPDRNREEHVAGEPVPTHPA